MRFFFIVFAGCFSFIARAQIGTADIGNAAPGNAVVGSSRIAETNLPGCTPKTSACNSTYIFTGNGNWNVEANWLGNAIPPLLLPAGQSIVIDPELGGEAILNVAQTISVGATLTLVPAKRLRVLKSLVFLK